MNTIDIYYSSFTKPLPSRLLAYHIGILPEGLREKNRRYLRWQDRHAHLFGKILLLKGLMKSGYSENILSQLKYTRNMRPYINDEIDFNISHSGAYVICAIGKNIRLGIDIEKINALELGTFSRVMDNEQWEEIHQSENPYKTFFQFWTIKESVIKADSRGLMVPLTEIKINNGISTYGSGTWYLTELDLHADYCSHLATNTKEITVRMKKIDFYQ